jgi:Putative addiction module component
VQTLLKTAKPWHNKRMNFLELQNQVEKLPVQERVALMQHIKHSLTAAELETFWVQEAEKVIDLVEAGQMATFTADELRKRRAARIAS